MSALDGMAVLLTGATGRAIAAAIRDAGGLAQASDMVTPEGCRAMVADVLAQEGRIGVLCSNAGVDRRGGILAISEED